MLNNTIFYWKCVKNVITQFGDIFKNIRIIRPNEDGSANQTIKVPLSYGPREKWLSRITEEPKLDDAEKVLVTLPRLSFEITGFEYDAARKLPRMNQFRSVDQNDDGIRSQFTPVPYNLNITLWSLTKTQEDGLQIIEQIIPWFGPDYTVSINQIPPMGIVQDVPFILKSVVSEDDYEGDYKKRRSVIYTLNFTAKMQFFGPVTNPAVIKHIIANIEAQPDFTGLYATYEADVIPEEAGPDDFTTIQEKWEEDF